MFTAFIWSFLVSESIKVPSLDKCDSGRHLSYSFYYVDYMKSYSLKLCFTAISIYTCRRDIFFRQLRQSCSNWAVRQSDRNVFSLLLCQFQQLKIDHAGRAGVQFCFIIALPRQTSPIFFVHSTLSSRPLSLFNHSSIHTFLLSLPVSTPLQPLSWLKIVRIITCGVLHTLGLFLATLLSFLFFTPFLFFFPLFPRRERTIQRERIRKRTEGNAERKGEQTCHG